MSTQAATPPQRPWVTAALEGLNTRKPQEDAAVMDAIIKLAGRFATSKADEEDRQFIESMRAVHGADRLTQVIAGLITLLDHMPGGMTAIAATAKLTEFFREVPSAPPAPVPPESGEAYIDRLEQYVVDMDNGLPQSAAGTDQIRNDSIPFLQPASTLSKEKKNKIEEALDNLTKGVSRLLVRKLDRHVAKNWTQGYAEITAQLKAEADTAPVSRDAAFAKGQRETIEDLLTRAQQRAKDAAGEAGQAAGQTVTGPNDERAGKQKAATTYLNAQEKEKRQQQYSQRYRRMLEEARNRLGGYFDNIAVKSLPAPNPAFTLVELDEIAAYTLALYDIEAATQQPKFDRPAISRKFDGGYELRPPSVLKF